MTQEELQKALEAISKGGITVNGDLVLSKHVEHEIGNVAAGGIGIQINHYGEGKTMPMSVSDKNIKVAIEELLKAKDERGEFVFKNEKPAKDTFFLFANGQSKYCLLCSDYAQFTNEWKMTAFSANPASRRCPSYSDM